MPSRSAPGGSPRTADFDQEISALVVEVAGAAIGRLENPVDRERLYVAATETGAMSWMREGGWANINDLGHALATFEILIRNLEIDSLEYILLWNTRWIENEAGRPPQAHPSAMLDHRPRLRTFGAASALTW